METGRKQEKSTGYSQRTKTGKESGLAPVESTQEKRVSPVLKNVHSKEELINSTGEVSASKLMAIQVMMGDFKALKQEMKTSWQASSNGKIYWCAEMTGHKLSILNGVLMVDETPVEKLLENLLAS